jgi:hypothetical protein
MRGVRFSLSFPDILASIDDEIARLKKVRALLSTNGAETDGAAPVRKRCKLSAAARKKIAEALGKGDLYFDTSPAPPRVRNQCSFRRTSHCFLETVEYLRGPSASAGRTFCLLRHTGKEKERKTMPFSRRAFLMGAGAAAVAAHPVTSFAQASGSPFKIAVINDEISPDFDHACHVVSQDFGLQWIELRSMWGKNLIALDAAEVDEAKRILAKYNLHVTDIASPLGKTDWPGAPKSPYGSKGDLHGAAETTFNQQDEILGKSIELAKQFNTDKVRCFDFWRLDDVTPYRAAIDERLRATAEAAGKRGILLVLENEFEFNTASKTHHGVRHLVRPQSAP